MPSKSWLLIFALQGLAIFVDEFVFHRRRGLPRWERIGHPLDTLSVLAPFLLTLLFADSENARAAFTILAIFSCVFITKDEFVHQKLCDGAETWLHAVLFILHPLAFIVTGLIWIHPEAGLRFAVVGQAFVIFGFMIYQIVYWSLIWKPQKPTEPSARPLTTTSTSNSAIVGTRLKMTPSLSYGPNRGSKPLGSPNA